MKTMRDLEDILSRIDHRGYPAYKQLRGQYDLQGLTLSIDHVQGDPFAAPSKLSVWVAHEVAGFPKSLWDQPHRRVAFEDFLLRRFERALSRRSYEAGGSGKSGLLATSRPGPEVLARSAAEVDARGITLRFEAGFPAHGRTTDARALDHMLLNLVPACAEEVLLATDKLVKEARRAADLADDQLFIREDLAHRDLVAFVADGSVLPRLSGVSARPLTGARPFEAPESLCVTLDLPHRGPTRGMAIRRGVTLVVGGGYHGKSTLLQALQDGVYDHVAGDGRELVITDASAVKLRAEDGRSVRAADISLFIGTLPNGRDTRAFSTLDASGSTSQAAGTIEALEAGTRALLIDEDTSATNFMVRDRLMEAVVSREHEPITPFVERVRDLWESAGVSSVIVAGSSGSFFSVADTVVQMDCYVARDITGHARDVCERLAAPKTPRAGDFALPSAETICEVRLVAGHDGRGRGRGPARGGSAGPREGRIKARCGRSDLTLGEGAADLRLVEQLVSGEQTSAIARLLLWADGQGLLDGRHTKREVVEAAFEAVHAGGWESLSEHSVAECGLTLPRPQELYATLDRWRDAQRA